MAGQKVQAQDGGNTRLAGSVFGGLLDLLAASFFFCISMLFIAFASFLSPFKLSGT
jgi:hypothetical protein